MKDFSHNMACAKLLALTEASFTKLVCEELVKAGAMVKPIVAARTSGQPGWPDRLVVHKAWMGLMEFKSGRLEAKVSRAQSIVCGQLNARSPGSAPIYRVVVIKAPNLIIDPASGIVVSTFTTAANLMSRLEMLEQRAP
jgi:hypothetical protein